MSFKGDRWLRRSASARVVVAAAVVVALWVAIYWAALPVPKPTPRESSLPGRPALRLIVAADQSAPDGGKFDRFDVDAQPIVAAVNIRGQVAFYARLIRGRKPEGIFLASGQRIARVAAIGDVIPGGGKISEFARHPVPSLNSAGKVLFGAAVTGGTTTEGIFLTSDAGLRAIALAGGDAPGVPRGTFLEFDTPILNDSDEVAFVATVRRGRETVQVLYLYRAGRLNKLVSSGDLTPRGGTFDRFGVPALNGKGVVAFAATVEHGSVLGGLYLAGTRDLTFLLGAGEMTAEGAMLARFSERIAIDDEDNVAFGAQLNIAGAESEAIFLVNATGLARVAKAGDAAPGGGRLAAFGAWPGIAQPAQVVFVAAVDGGTVPAGVFAWRNGMIERVAVVGEPLPEGATLASLAINPAPATASNGAVTFVTMAERNAGKTAIYYFGPPPQTD